MRSLLAALVPLLLVGIPAVARADIPGPNDHLCNVETQARDGAQCEACSWSPPHGDEPCSGPFRDRGWTVRCTKGATVVTEVWCDRPGDVVSGGNGPAGAQSGSCGCRVPGASSHSRGAPWLAVPALLALLGWRRIRRP